METPAFETATVTGLDVAVLPRVSRATAVSTCVPLSSPRVSHGIEYGAVVSSAPRFWPPRRNWTPATARLSVALAVTVIGPETVPAAGAVIEICGGVVSPATVALSWFDGGPTLPAASCAVTR